MLVRGLDSEDVWDHENAFYWFSHPSRINKFLAHYELYKSISHLPGAIMELGVYKAASLIRLASFRNALENDFSRKIIGFDAFGSFPRDELSLKSDIEFVDEFESIGGEGLNKDEILEIFKKKNFENIELIKGNVFETLPKYLTDNPATKISFLHLDMDVKEPTVFALEQLWERMVPDGIVVFDDYNTVAGETEAVDDFLKSQSLVIEKTTLNYIPSFVRKPA